MNEVAHTWKLRIEDPAAMAEAWGSEMYFISFNDGYDCYHQGHRLEKPYWYAYHEAKLLGHRRPRAYAHGFCDGYRFAEGAQEEPTS